MQMATQISDIMLYYKLWQTGIDMCVTFKSVTIYFLKQSMINRNKIIGTAQVKT